MKQYKYFHSTISNSYISKITDEPNTPLQVKEIFQKMRLFGEYGVARGTEAFAYCATVNNFFMYQINIDSEEFCHGIEGKLSDLMLDGESPVKYAFKLDKKYKDSDMEQDLPQYNLQKVYSTINMRGLLPVFDKIIDAILYSNKQTFIIAQDIESIKQYANMIFNLLPKEKAYRQGFSINASKFNFNYNSELNQDYNTKINLHFTTDKKLYSEKEIVANVFDVTGSMLRTNYDASLHAYSVGIKSIEKEISSGVKRIIDSYVREMTPAFSPDGTINEQMLEIATDVFMFQNEQTYELASKILQHKANNVNHYILEHIIEQALYVVSDSNECSETDYKNMALIKNDKTLHASLIEAINQIYVKRLLGKLENDQELSLLEKEEIVDKLTSNTKDREFLNSFLSYPCNLDVYQILALCYAKTFNNDYLYQMVSYFDYVDDSSFDGAYNIPEQELEICIKNLYDSIERSSDPQKAAIGIYSAYLMGIYMHLAKNANERLDNKFFARLSCFKEILKKYHFNSIMELEFLLDIKREIANLSMLKFNIPVFSGIKYEYLPKNWINELVEKINFTDFVNSFDTLVLKLNDYSTLNEIIINRFIDLDTIKIEITRYSGEFVEKVKDITRRVSISQKEKNDILAYLDNLCYESNMNLEMHKYRMDFVIDCYKTLSTSQQEELKGQFGNDIIEKMNANYDNSESQRVSKQKIVDAVINYFKSNSQKTSFVSKGLSGYVVSAFLISIGFYLLLFMLFMLPPVLKSVLLGINFIDQIKEYFEVYYLIFPFGIWIYYMVVFFKGYFDGQVTRKKYCIKKATLNSLLFGLIPTLVYLIAYLIMYFTGFMF